MGEQGKNDKEERNGPCDPEIQARKIREIKGALYCFHPKSPRGLTTMITK